MSITYPLSMPSSPGLMTARLTMRNVVGISESPTTLAQQVLDWNADAWLFDGVLPRIPTRAQAAPWQAFLAALKGPVGTFLAGDPNGRFARGSAGKNLLLVTEEFDDLRWTKFGGTTVTANTDTAPDSTTTADSINFAAKGANNVDGVFQQIVNGYIPGQTYTGSVYLRCASGTQQVELVLADEPFASFAASAIVTVTTTRQRFQLTGVLPPSASPDLGFWIRAPFVPASGAYTVFASWAQVEPGSGPTTYQRKIAPQCNGATAARANQLPIKQLVPNSIGTLLAGDYFQIGTGTSSRLYMNLTDVNADGSGLATLDIWPTLRGPTSDGLPIVIVNPKGLFRLTDLDRVADLDELLHYPNLAFKAREAL